MNKLVKIGLFFIIIFGIFSITLTFYNTVSKQNYETIDLSTEEI